MNYHYIDGESINPAQTKQLPAQALRTHRVGTATAGVALVVFGSLFLLSGFFGLWDFRIAFQLWPLILVGLGLEMLLSTTPGTKFVYDKGAIVLLFFMAAFAVFMAGTDMVLQHMSQEKLQLILSGI